MNLLYKYNLHPGDRLSAFTLKEKILYLWKVRYYWLQTIDFACRVKNKLNRMVGKS